MPVPKAPLGGHLHQRLGPNDYNDKGLLRFEQGFAPLGRALPGPGSNPLKAFDTRSPLPHELLCPCEAKPQKTIRAVLIRHAPCEA
jgi:hypothetical protein